MPAQGLALVGFKVTVDIINTNVGTQTPAASRQGERGPRDCSPAEKKPAQEAALILGALEAEEGICSLGWHRSK